MRWACPSNLSVCLFVCQSVCRQNAKAIFSKTKHFRAMVSIDDLQEVVKNPLLDPYNPRWRRSAILDLDAKMRLSQKLSNLDDRIMQFSPSDSPGTQVFLY